MIEVRKRGKRRHIHMTRGDFASLRITVRNKNDEVIACDGENIVVKVQVREPPGNGTPLLFDGEIHYTTKGEAVWIIRPNDTRWAEKDKYVYDVQVQLEDDIVFTFIPLSDFVLLTESTEKGVRP